MDWFYSHNYHVMAKEEIGKETPQRESYFGILERLCLILLRYRGELNLTFPSAWIFMASSALRPLAPSSRAKIMTLAPG